MDLALDDTQEQLVATLRAFLARHGGPEVVRAAEDSGGFDITLWDGIVELGLPSLAVPVVAGGSGASAVDQVLISEQIGAGITPVPLIEHLTATAVLGESGADIAPSLASGTEILTFALHPSQQGLARLVPAGSTANTVIGLDDDELVMVTSAPPVGPVPNLGGGPLADRDLRSGERITLAKSVQAAHLYKYGVARWQLLIGGALVGIASAALDQAVAYVKERQQFDVPLGSFQAVAHRLADVATEIEGCRLLGREAAWLTDEGDLEAAEVTAMSYVAAAETAQRAVAWSLHFHGGYGFMLEYDIQLYFRRAKAWTLALGDPRRTYQMIADIRYGQVGTTTANGGAWTSA